MKLKFLLLILLSFLVAACSANQTRMPYVKNLETPTREDEFPAQDQTKTPQPGDPEFELTNYPVDFTYAGDMDAPELPEDAIWINTVYPYNSMEDLKGKIVVLDFWSQGCVLCLQVQKELIQLQEEYKDSLVVIGVHSAKYPQESSTSVISDAIKQNNIPFPVIIDEDFTIWHSYGITAWPTVLLIDPLGKVIGHHTGIGVLETYRPILNVMKYEFGDLAGLIDQETTAPFQNTGVSREALSYPKSILADSQTDRLYISDTNHNRIIVLTLKGEILFTIGTGNQGFSDGNYFQSAFSKPEGLALSEDKQYLYVADTGNHAIREIDLIYQQVSTLAGTGKAGKLPIIGSDPHNVSISSPRDLIYLNNSLYISISGFNQIWRFAFEDSSFEPVAGSGVYGYLDGEAVNAQLSQVRGLTTDGNGIYFADSEASAIRNLSLGEEQPLISTLVGNGMFQFGDLDGIFEEALLRHPLGIDKQANFLFVTDTYNHKIKSINLDSQTVSTWAGTGEIGLNDGVKEAASFNFPHDINIAGNLMFIADTNNNVIRLVDIYTGMIETLEFSNLPLVYPYTIITSNMEKESQSVAPGDGKISFSLHLPLGYKFNSEAPFYLYLSSENDQVIDYINPSEPEFDIIPEEWPVVIDVTFLEGSTTIILQGMVVYCEIEKEDICTVEEINISFPVEINPNETITSIQIPHYIEPILEE